MIIINTKSDLNISDVKIKKPYDFNQKKQIFNIYHKDDDPLLIQTPDCFLPFNYNLYDNRYFQMDLVLLKNNEEFVSLLHSIFEYLLNKIESKYEIKCKKEYITKQQNGSYKLRLINNNHDTIRLFNHKKQLIDLRNLCKEDRVCCIFQIDKVILSDYNFSINMN